MARTTIGTIGRPLETYSCFSFRGGLDVKSSATDVGTRRQNKTLRRANHVVFTSSGAVTKRFDADKYNTTSLGSTVAITGGIQFRHSNGTNYILCGTDDGRLVSLASDGGTSNVKTGLSTGVTWSMAVYNDKVISCNRVDVPRKWNGTTDAVLGGSPPVTGGPVVAHSNRVFMLDATAKSTLYWCALNSEEDWTTASNAGSVAINPNDGQNLVAMVSTIKGDLMLGKPNTIYRLQGTAPSTYTITNVLPAMAGSGAVSQNGMLFAMTDTWTLGPDGIHGLVTTQAYGDLKEVFASEPISPYFTPGTAFTVTLQNLPSAVSVYDRQNSRLGWAIDTDGDAKNDMLFWLDLYTRGWSIWPGMSIASLWPVYNTTNGRTEIFAGGYDGFVRVLNRQSSTNAFTADARHLSALDSPGVEKTPRHLFMHFVEQGNTNVTVTTSNDFGAGGGTSASVSLLDPNTKTLGTNWTLGTDALGKKAQVIKRIDLPSGTAEFVEVRVANGNAGDNFTWLGYELMYRRRRTLRRGT